MKTLIAQFTGGGPLGGQGIPINIQTDIPPSVFQAAIKSEPPHYRPRPFDEPPPQNAEYRLISYDHVSAVYVLIGSFQDRLLHVRIKHDALIQKVNLIATKHFDWMDKNRVRDFDSWGEEVAFAFDMGYKLVPPLYQIPHHSVEFDDIGKLLPKLYVMRAGGEMLNLQSCFDKPAQCISYPIFYKVPDAKEG